MRLGLVIAVAVTVLSTEACGAGPSTAPDQKVTPRALAGATVHHIGQRPTSAAPTYPSQDDRIAKGSFDLEVRFPKELRVSVSVLPKGAGKPTCRPSSGKGDGNGGGVEYADNQDGCVVGTRNGRPWRMLWQDEEPEEDPGIVTVIALAGDRLVSAALSGPTIHGDPRSGGTSKLTDRLIDLVTDPAVGRRTSEAYVLAGNEISDKVWEDWSGQDDGAPEPAELG